MTDAFPLQAFLTANPPDPDNIPASADLADQYRDHLPDSLLALWTRYGFGFYGDSRIQLVSPGDWQAILDRWIVTPAGEAVRTPIAVTPFGCILYYRRLSETDEDVALIDPHLKSTEVLSWDLDGFFNDFLTSPDEMEFLAPTGMLQVAQETCGPLAAGEVYEADQTLLQMEMLKLAKVDALSMHTRLRAEVDPPSPFEEPKTVREALPAEHVASFAGDDGSPDGVTGLYLATYIDWYKALSLAPDGTYRLLFWRIHYKTGKRQEIRAYDGSYTDFTDVSGDRRIRLDIRLNGNSLGSDANDSDLLVSISDGATRLLSVQYLDDIAKAMANRGVLGRSEHVYVKLGLDDRLPGYDSDGEDAAVLANGMPAALRTALATH